MAMAQSHIKTLWSSCNMCGTFAMAPNSLNSTEFIVELWKELCPLPESIVSSELSFLKST